MTKQVKQEEVKQKVTKEKSKKPKPTKPKTLKEKSGPTITRMQAATRAIQAINGEATIKDIIKATSQIAVKHGHPENLNESKWAVRKALPVFAELGLIIVDGQEVKRVQQ